MVRILVREALARLAGHEPEVVERVSRRHHERVVAVGDLDQAVVPDRVAFVQFPLGAIDALEAEALGRVELGWTARGSNGLGASWAMRPWGSRTSVP
jgi:hypothetical protein